MKKTNAMTDVKLKTKFRIKKEQTELEIYRKREELLRNPESMATAVDEYLCDEYGFASAVSIWFIRKRVEKRLAEADAADAALKSNVEGGNDE